MQLNENGQKGGQSVRIAFMAALQLGCGASVVTPSTDAGDVPAAADTGMSVDALPQLDPEACRIEYARLGSPRASIHTPAGISVIDGNFDRVPLTLYYRGECRQRLQNISLDVSWQGMNHSSTFFTVEDRSRSTWTNEREGQLVEPLPTDNDSRLKWVGTVDLQLPLRRILMTPRPVGDGYMRVAFRVQNSAPSNVSSEALLLQTSQVGISTTNHPDQNIMRAEVSGLTINVTNNGGTERLACLDYSTLPFSSAVDTVLNNLRGNRPNCLYFSSTCPSNQVCGDTTPLSWYGTCSSNELCAVIQPGATHTFAVPSALQAVLPGDSMTQLSVCVNAISYVGIPTGWGPTGGLRDCHRFTIQQ